MNISAIVTSHTLVLDTSTFRVYKYVSLYYCSGRATSVTIKLYPATGESSDQKWVCLTLQLQLPDDVCTVDLIIFDIFVLVNLWFSKHIAESFMKTWCWLSLVLWFLWTT